MLPSVETLWRCWEGYGGDGKMSNEGNAGIGEGAINNEAGEQAGHGGRQAQVKRIARPKPLQKLADIAQTLPSSASYSRLRFGSDLGSGRVAPGSNSGRSGGQFEVDTGAAPAQGT